MIEFVVVESSPIRGFCLGVFVAALTGCAPGGADGDGGDEPAVGTAGGVRLEVRSSNERGRIGELVAGPDARYVIVDVRIENALRPAPVPLAAPLFAVRTVDGLELLGGVESELLAQPCRAGVQVAQGGHHECSVAFEVPHEEDVAALVYRPDPSVEVLVPFESERCTPCGDDCVDLSKDPDHCGECSNAVGAEQWCERGVVACADGLVACGVDCVDLSSDRAHCGECFAHVPSQRLCVDGAARCPEYSSTVCGGECVDLRNDPDHCGECGHRVEICANGQPTCAGSLQWCAETCVDIYTAPAHCGECGNVCVGEYECREGDCVTLHSTQSTIATCFGVCNSLGLGCSAGRVRYYGLLSCPGNGGGLESRYESVGCNEIPEQEHTATSGNGCSYFGTASELECWCLQP